VWNGFVVGPGTAVKGVDLLAPGRFLELDEAGEDVRQEELWRIPGHAPDPTLFERPKSGFVLPFDRWIRRGLKAAIGSDPAGPAGHHSNRPQS
jgi:hypothetical protein